MKRHGSSVEQRAEVVATAHDCDLALLRVPGGPEALGGGLLPLSLHDGVPMLQERVTVMGFPTGGANLSITQGIVSRIGTVLLPCKCDYDTRHSNGANLDSCRFVRFLLQKMKAQVQLKLVPWGGGVVCPSGKAYIQAKVGI